MHLALSPIKSDAMHCHQLRMTETLSKAADCNPPVVCLANIGVNYLLSVKWHYHFREGHFALIRRQTLIFCKGTIVIIVLTSSRRLLGKIGYNGPYVFEEPSLWGRVNKAEN